jgi:hypothetical protein
MSWLLWWCFLLRLELFVNTHMSSPHRTNAPVVIGYVGIHLLVRLWLNGLSLNDLLVLRSTVFARVVSLAVFVLEG